jgi:hypothetical protein
MPCAENVRLEHMKIIPARLSWTEPQSLRHDQALQSIECPLHRERKRSSGNGAGEQHRRVVDSKARDDAFAIAACAYERSYRGSTYSNHC